MKLKNLFYLLLALPLVFAACEEDPNTDNTPDTPEVKDPVLTLTSAATLEFAAEGGAGEITYTLENAKEGVVVTAECAAEWVTNVTVAEKVTFEVAANDATEAREAVIVVKYDTQKFEVAVKQAAKVEEKPAYDHEAELVYAERLQYEDYELDPNQILVYFADEEEVYNIAVEFVMAEGVNELAAGTYSMADGSISDRWTSIYVESTDEELYFVDGTAEVALANGVYTIDMVLTAENEKTFHFTFENEIENMEYVPVVVPSVPTEFTPVKVTASYYSSGNFILNLFATDSKRHEFDMYDEVNPNDTYLSDGTYSSEDGTIGLGDSYFFNGQGQVGMKSAELTLKLNADWTVTITGEFASVEGQCHTINWTGTIVGFTYPGMPTDMKVVRAEAKVRNNTTWEILLWDIVDTATQTEDFTRIVVTLAEANKLYVSNGTYSTAAGTVLLCSPIDNAQSFYHGLSTTGCEITDCELTVAVDTEAENAKFTGYFVAGGSRFNFDYTGAVDGFLYKEVVSDGIVDWKNFTLKSQSTHPLYDAEADKYNQVKYAWSYIVAESTDGTKFEFYLINTLDPAQGIVASGSYPVGDFNNKDKMHYLDMYSKVNGNSGLELGGELVVEQNGSDYTITFDITDKLGTNWKGSYTGAL